MARPFSQVDVFTSTPYRGNPLAVVLDGEPGADYRVRIFTPIAELPFAGHPTLGTCHAWLAAGGTPRQPDLIVQECAAGLVTLRRTPDGLAFAAPPMLRDGPVDGELLAHIALVLRIDQSAIVDASWADNGPGWVAVLLDSADAVLAVKPGPIDLDLGVAGPTRPARRRRSRCGAFFPRDGSRSRTR